LVSTTTSPVTPLSGHPLAGHYWAWPQRPIVRPPGSRLPDTPITTLATHTVDGHRFDLVSYLDTAGGRCIAIDRDGRRGSSACDIQVDEQHLASAAMTMATRGHGTAAVYGRVHDSVTELYAIMKNGERVDWPHLRRSAERRTLLRRHRRLPGPGRHRRSCARRQHVAEAVLRNLVQPAPRPWPPEVPATRPLTRGRTVTPRPVRPFDLFPERAVVPAALRCQRPGRPRPGPGDSALRVRTDIQLSRQQTSLSWRI
jgi:hypothetical protein